MELEYDTVHLLTNPKDEKDRISITQLSKGYWVARRYSGPQMNVATIKDHEIPPFSNPERWDCREGQRDFWNKVLKEWNCGFIIWEEPPDSKPPLNANRIKRIIGGDSLYSRQANQDN